MELLASEIPCIMDRESSPTAQKKVDFNLSATGWQDFYEYRRKVKRGKYPNPFDASKKPGQKILKHSNPSPISPFFKRAYNINYWTPDVTTEELIQQSIVQSESEEDTNIITI